MLLSTRQRAMIVAGKQLTSSLFKEETETTCKSLQGSQICSNNRLDLLGLVTQMTGQRHTLNLTGRRHVGKGYLP